MNENTTGNASEQKNPLQAQHEQGDAKNLSDSPAANLKSMRERQEAVLTSREVSAAVREKTVDAREQTADARELAAEVRENEADSREIAATAREELSDESEALRMAVQDQIVRLQEVNECLVVAGVNSQMLTEQLQQAKVDMAHLAHHDFLTDLPNRIHLEERLAQAITWARRHGTKFAILYLDLDRFKNVNDSLGHRIGDQLLKEVAQRLLMSIRSLDTVCRQGGDKFIVLLSEVNHLDGLITKVERIHCIVTESYAVAGHVLHVGASIGISIYPDNGATKDTLIQHAEAAMYSVKQCGRNTYAFFEKAMNDSAIARHGMETSLHEALARQEFVLYYQAQIALQTGNITGAEALIRWRHPVKGLLSPAWFVSFAEECGAILPIGRWVLREACTQAQTWLKAGLAFAVIAVNISASEFEAGDFLEYVLLILQETGLSPQHLELELTEGVLMKDTEETIQKLTTLRSLGIRIAIDDFGTGYSSLSYLKRFPVDTLKIDQSFVGDIRTNETDDILVNAVISIGKGLRHQVVAEGIETAEQLAFLRERQCTSGQGFLLSMPMPAEDFADLLAHGPKDSNNANMKI